MVDDEVSARPPHPGQMDVEVAEVTDHDDVGPGRTHRSRHEPGPCDQDPHADDGRPPRLGSELHSGRGVEGERDVDYLDTVAQRLDTLADRVDTRVSAGVVRAEERDPQGSTHE